ncbi:MAG: papain-like cysteine protease family protein [Verrucomicrobiota bacterium]
MSPRPPITLLGLCFCLCSTTLALDLSQERVWTDIRGRSIRATLIEIDGRNQMKMRRADGLDFEIHLRLLSKEDQALVREFKTRGDPLGRPSPFEKRGEATAQSPDPAGPEKEREALPEKLTLRDVPMVRQHGNFCVPASAAMIAGFHNVKTDQDEVAQLSSESSISNQGTNPHDMLLAMNKLGFRGEALYWEDTKEFHGSALPAIRRALVETGPVYISFKSGVFGSMGHGCVITGFNHRREEMYFHNPWGTTFEKEYEEIAEQGRGVVFIDPPMAAPVATHEWIERIRGALPAFPGSLELLHQRLKAADVDFELVWCSRTDARADKHFAKNTALREGRKILELAFERNPAVLIPYSPDGVVAKYFFVTRPPEGGARFLIREITESGWTEPELKTLGRLTREWATRVDVPRNSEDVWELPMFELRP